MKRILLLSIALCCAMSMASAQDIINKTDATQIEAKVIEITSSEVRYKRFSNPDGPIYILPAGEVASIRYANGEVENFNEAKARTQPAAQQPAPAALQYKIGDIYDRNGVRGVVCSLTDDGTHGLILSLEEHYFKWNGAGKFDLRKVGVDNDMDGAVNMERMEAFIAAGNLLWADFPAFKWCRELGEGWYLPSAGELLNIGIAYNGGQRRSTDKKFREQFNDAITAAGGERISKMGYYYSSTEVDDKNAYIVHMNVEPPYLVATPKNTQFLVRAVHKF